MNPCLSAPAGLHWLWVAAILLAAAPLAPAASDYDSLPGRKALAVAPGGSNAMGVAQGQRNDLLASLTALQLCESKRQPQDAACEVRRLNDETITSGAEIRARVPETNHPLHLWRLRGATATVFVAGSVHVLKESLYPLPAPYEQAFAAADKLVVEVNLSAQDPATLQQKTLRYAALPAGQRIDSVVPADLRSRLTDSLQRYGVPPAEVATLNPAFLMNQLVLLRLSALGYQGEWGVEQHFLRKAADRPVLELETVDEQLSLLFDQPIDLQLQLLRDTLDQEDHIEPLLAGMVTGWLAGDDALFMEMFEAQSGESPLAQQFTEHLLDERNRAMAGKITAFLGTGQGTYFVLVGAAHLLGENGIVALLRADGMQPERLHANSTP